MVKIIRVAKDLVYEVNKGLTGLALKEKKAIKDIVAAEKITGVLENVIKANLRQIVVVFDNDIKQSGKDPFHMPNAKTLMTAFVTVTTTDVSLFRNAAGILLKSKEPGLEVAGGILNGLATSLEDYLRLLFQTQSDSQQARDQLIRCLGKFGTEEIRALESEKAILHQKENW